MSNKIKWKEAGEEIFRWLAIFAAGSAAFLIAFGKGILFPMVIVGGVFTIVWLVRGVNFAVEVAGATLLMTGLWGLIVVFEYGKEPVGPFELKADPWASYMFAVYFVLGCIIVGRMIRSKQ